MLYFNSTNGYPKYFSYGENGIFVEQSLYITYTQTYL